MESSDDEDDSSIDDMLRTDESYRKGYATDVNKLNEHSDSEFS